MRLFRNLRHSKAAIYMRKFRKPCAGPKKTHARMRHEKTLTFHFKLTPEFRVSLGIC